MSKRDKNLKDADAKHCTQPSYACSNSFSSLNLSLFTLFLFLLRFRIAYAVTPKNHVRMAHAHPGNFKTSGYSPGRFRHVPNVNGRRHNEKQNYIRT